MIRGLFIRFNFPYATFPCTSPKGDQLLPLFMEAIFRVELCGLYVDSITLDGNSVNRRFFKLLSLTKDPIGYRTINPCRLDHHIYFVSDPPHLIKTTRNCFANQNRTLMVTYNLLISK